MPEMQMTRLQLIQFVLIILALPAQILLVEWANNHHTQVSQLQSMESLMSSWNSVLKSYFTFSVWSIWLNTIWKNGWKINFKSDMSEIANNKHMEPKESVAVEIFLHRNIHGYFATSTKTRDPRPKHVKYRVGQIIKHKKYGYLGVIVGWDDTCNAPEDWIKANHRVNMEYRKQPHYAILLDRRNQLQAQTTYVAEENIEITVNVAIKHSGIDDYFDFYDGAQYHMRPAMKALYPHD